MKVFIFHFAVLLVTTIQGHDTLRKQNTIDDFAVQTKKIIDFMTTGEGKSVGYNWLANITDTFGPRPTGSAALEQAIDYTIETLIADGFQHVHTEAVPLSNYWKRGVEVAKLVHPRNYTMAILGFGASVPTPLGGITAQVYVVRSFAELKSVFNEEPEKLKGTILVFNEPWLGSYELTVNYRYGASAAAEVGAVAALVRSITPFSVYSPHTGATSYSNPNLRIPTAAITVEDAEMLWRMQHRGDNLRMHLEITSGYVNKSTTIRNTVFELQGREKPHEIVLLSGHFDSWDVGQGAMDDGAGCAVMWHALKALKSLGLVPRRTIRVVFWTGEEYGYIGTEHYYKAHKSVQHLTNETFIVVADSDEGAFKPTSKNATMEFFGTETDLLKMQQISGQLQWNNIPIGIHPTSAMGVGEVYFWSKDGIPGFSYINHDKLDYYFTFHHTNADTMTVLKPEDLDYTGAAFAVFANILANMDQSLEQVPKVHD